MAEAGGERGWGYDGVDLWAPHHAYGGPDGLKRLVDACHRRDSPWSSTSSTTTWGRPAITWLSSGRISPSSYRTPWGSAVNMDGAGSYGVRDFVISNALMWLRDYHLDGLRLDAVHAIYRRERLAHNGGASDRRRRPWPPNWAASCGSSPRATATTPALRAPREQHGYGISAAWDDDFHHALHTVLTGENDGLLRRLRRDRAAGQGVHRRVCVRRGVLRVAPAPPRPPCRRTCPGASFVVCLQNHDQVGNRALGDRTSHLLGPDRAQGGRRRCCCCQPFVPMLFQGEEWGASTLVPVLHRPPGPRAGQGGHRRPSRRTPTLQARASPNSGARPPTRKRPRPSCGPSSTGLELDREPHRSLLAWHRQLIALRAGANPNWAATTANR